MRALLKVLAIHLAANAALMALAYYWLGVGETRSLTLAWSAFLALVVLCGGCCTYGATIVYFETREFGGAWRTALRHLVPLAIAVMLIGVIYALPMPDWSVPVASFLTLKSRMAVKPERIASIFSWVYAAVSFVVIPVLLLPIVGAVASQGWRGFRNFGLRKWQYWIQTPVLLWFMIWLPLKLMGFVRLTGGFAAESISLVLRFTLAYLFFGAAWLALALKTSGGIPRDTKSRTAAS